MQTCWIGIGANIGDARAAFDDAWRRLNQHPQIQLHQRSGIYQTKPVGVAAGGTFSNAVISLTTSLSPLELLDELQAVETALGRTHDVRWGPRPIDLDLLFVDQIVLNHPRLTIPHPAAWYRRFVLDPLVEIGPGLSHPLLNASVGDLQRLLQQRPFVVGLDESQVALVQELQAQSTFNSADICFQVRPEDGIAASVCVRLDTQEASDPRCNGIPVADLTCTPGDPLQRVIDFCASVLDEPMHVNDWPYVRS